VVTNYSNFVDNLDSMLRDFDRNAATATRHDLRAVRYIRWHFEHIHQSIAIWRREPDDTEGAQARKKQALDGHRETRQRLAGYLARYEAWLGTDQAVVEALGAAAEDADRAGRSAPTAWALRPLGSDRGHEPPGAERLPWSQR
jgi:hypothetical protein